LESLQTDSAMAIGRLAVAARPAHRGFAFTVRA